MHVVYPNSEEFSIEPGGDAELAFTAVNLSESKSDRLKSIKTDYAGSVKIDEKDGTLEIKPQFALGAGNRTSRFPRRRPSTSA